MILNKSVQPFPCHTFQFSVASRVEFSSKKTKQKNTTVLKKDVTLNQP